MAEDLGKEEEKFDFTPEGESLGYISLAQARILAMSTAQETPGEYGRRYRDVPMAFDTVEASEDEDFYIFTHPETEEWLDRRQASIREAFAKARQAGAGSMAAE